MLRVVLVHMSSRFLLDFFILNLVPRPLFDEEIWVRYFVMLGLGFYRFDPVMSSLFLASPQTSFGVRLSRIKMNALQTYRFLLNSCIRLFQGWGTPVLELAVKQPIAKGRSRIHLCMKEMKICIVRFLCKPVFEDRLKICWFPGVFCSKKVILAAQVREALFTGSYAHPLFNR